MVWAIGWKFDGKGAALAKLTGYLDGAAVSFDDELDDAEPQAAAAGLASQALIDLVETVKYLPASPARQAYTVVGYG